MLRCPACLQDCIAFWRDPQHGIVCDRCSLSHSDSGFAEHISPTSEQLVNYLGMAALP
jgi:hypothetical protein